MRDLGGEGGFWGGWVRENISLGGGGEIGTRGLGWRPHIWEVFIGKSWKKKVW